MVDGYVDPTTVGTWLDSLAASPKPIVDLLHGLVATSATDPAALYETFNLSVSPALEIQGNQLSPERPSVWKIPPPPLAIVPAEP
jgi:hypothetical protein